MVGVTGDATLVKDEEQVGIGSFDHGRDILTKRLETWRSDPAASGVSTAAEATTGTLRWFGGTDCRPLSHQVGSDTRGGRTPVALHHGWATIIPLMPAS
jgi:hypothetical protein